jgi:hypothetical protein
LIASVRAVCEHAFSLLKKLAHHHQVPPARASRHRAPARPVRADQHRGHTLTDGRRRRQPPTTGMSTWRPITPAP